MIDFTMDEGKGLMTLSGDLNIQHAQSLRDALLEAVEKVSHLTLNLEQVSSADLSFTQILCATHRTLLAEGKTLAVAGNIPDAVRETVELTGFKGCAAKNDNTGLWTGVTN